MTQAIRNFAKSLESWLTHAMVNIPEEMLRVKVRLTGLWGQARGRGLSGGWGPALLSPVVATGCVPVPVPSE